MSGLPETIEVGGVTYRKEDKTSVSALLYIQEVRPIYKPSWTGLDLRCSMPGGMFMVKPMDIIRATIIGKKERK